MHIKPCKNDSDKNVLYIVQHKNSTDTTQSEKTINKSIQSYFEMASLKWYIYMYVSVVVLALDSTVIQLSLKVWGRCSFTVKVEEAQYDQQPSSWVSDDVNTDTL